MQKTVSSISSIIETSVLGLMGLLIGFSFYAAGTRFDARRSLMGQEANAIGTAYLRIDLLPRESQPPLREDFREYIRSRLATFHKIPDMNAVNEEIARSSDLQRNIWQRAVEATKGSGPAVQVLVLSSLNEMIDITTVQTVAAMTHTPFAVFIMLALTVVVSSGLMGYASATSGVRDWVYLMTFAIVLGTALYLILDYEYPRIALVRVDSVDKVLIDTLEKMK